MNFVAIDVETANASMASICQIGLAEYENGVLSEEWKLYVDPQDYFDDINVSIHGIDQFVVEGSSTFRELIEPLRSVMDDTVVVSHTHFDRVAIHQACARSVVNVPVCTWLDSSRAARIAWTEFARKGYGLYNVCAFLGYDFKHHDALEDAKAAAHILLAATVETGLDKEGWIRVIGQPVDGSSYPENKREGNPEGALYGEVIVFTGALKIPRSYAAELASAIGCQVASGVTIKTTLLVVGDQDISRLAGHKKSSAHRKVEDLIKKGVPIRILKESDFKEMVQLSNKIA